MNSSLHLIVFKHLKSAYSQQSRKVLENPWIWAQVPLKKLLLGQIS